MDIIKVVNLDINRVVPDPDNARLHDDRNIRAIAGSLEKFGQQKPIVIDGDYRVIAGNGTVSAAQSLGWKKIQAVKTELTGDEARAFALADNRTAELAEWDDRILKVQLGELLKVDFDIEAIGFDVPGAEGEGGEGGGPDGNEYTSKVEVPTYQITGEKPDIKELLDRDKTAALHKKIREAKLPPALKKFLEFAAYRHLVFSYDKIAEFYAHSEQEVQELMEDSALVVIDFDKAIEGGFVEMAEAIAEQYGRERGYEDYHCVPKIISASHKKVAGNKDAEGQAKA